MGGRRGIAGLALVLALVAGLAGAADAPGAVAPRMWESVYDWPGGHGYAGWSTRTTSADVTAYGFAHGLGGQPGLWLWPQGGREHRPGSGGWILTAPGTTRIARAGFDTAYVEKLFAHHCVSAGLRDARGSRDTIEHCNPPHAGGAAGKRLLLEVSDPAGEPLATEAHLTVRMPECANPADTPCSKHLPLLDPLEQGPFARGTRVQLELVDDDLPVPRASGRLRELEDGYINGRELVPVTLEAADAGAGVRGVTLERLGAGVALAADADCDPTHHTESLGSRICPGDLSAALELDPRAFPEGAHWFRTGASDFAGQTGAEDPWRVYVDRTPPPAPYDFDVDLDQDTDVATITWVADDDPALADGSPGSGLASWEHRFWHSRLGWSDWHRGVESVEVPESIEGDEIRVEVRSLDAVENGSPLATGTVVVPVEDEEDGFEENLDDDEDPLVGSVSSVDAGEPATTVTLRAVSAKERREAALARVVADCRAPVVKIRCYEAVKAACKVGGVCKAAKAQACSSAKLYCPKADSAAVSLVERYQPTFRLERGDMFWPVSLNTALKMRWDGKLTCYVQNGHCRARGAAGIRELLGPDGTSPIGDLYLDLPTQKDDIDETFRSTTDALGLPRVDTHRPLYDPQWEDVYKSSRIYWYRGGGIGRNTGTAKTLQYWTFHTYNYLGTVAGAQGKHEGDLEMVGVVLSADNEPRWVIMSRHGLNLSKEARLFAWNDTRLERPGGGTHVMAYSARGSHAMYERCGDFKRAEDVNNLPDDEATPDDHVSCEPGTLLNFTFARTRRVSLARTSWACWGGRIGNGGDLPRFSNAPQAPLWQQATFSGDPRPCEAARPTALSARSVSSVRGEVAAPRRDAPSARASDHRADQDPLVDAFAHCDDWHQPPTQPGVVVVACDQEQLDRYIASGLTDPGRGGAELSGPGGAANGVPSVYAGEDAAAIDRVSVRGAGTATGVYVSTLSHEGVLLEATFPAIVLPEGQVLRVHLGADVAELRAADGTPMAVAPLTPARTNPTRRTARPGGLRVRVRGRRATVRWRGEPGVRYVVAAGARQRGSALRRIARTRPSRRATFRADVAVRPRDRWIAVTGFRRSGRGPTAYVRIPQRGRSPRNG